MKITKTVNITRYSNNRKLYAKSGEINDSGGYVSLLDIAEEIKKGNTVNISDETGTDVTNKVLKQLINKLDVSNSDLLGLIRS